MPTYEFRAPDGTILRSPEDSAPGDALSVRVAGGRFGVERTTNDPYIPPTAQEAS